MRPTSNVHTHTTFCDGKNTAEEMVRAAALRGFATVGFSGHAYAPEPAPFGMDAEKLAAYKAEILRLKQKYAGTIDVLLGVELEGLLPCDTSGCDYVIGSLHILRGPLTGRAYCVDDTAEMMSDCVENGFSSREAAYEDYYEKLAEAVETLHPDIVGHMDAIRKFNRGGCMFDESTARYKAAAIACLRRCVAAGSVIEINTAPIRRGDRDMPYPDAFLLDELAAAGAPVVLTADAHADWHTGFAFNQTMGILADRGVKNIVQLTARGFEAVTPS